METVFKNKQKKENKRREQGRKEGRAQRRAGLSFSALSCHEVSHYELPPWAQGDMGRWPWI